jgi:hypothetical protein
MRRVGLQLAIALVATGPGFAQQESPHVFKILVDGCPHQSIVQTGFRVEGVVGIVTALHGVANCTTINAASEAPADGSGERLQFLGLHIDRIDFRRDVAVLTSRDLQTAPAVGLRPSTDDLSSSDLRALGYALASAAQRSIEQLNVSTPATAELRDLLEPELVPLLAKRGSPDVDARVLNLEGQLVPGFSGAPILTSDGRVVAVGLGGLRGGTVGISWAAPWRDLELVDIGEGSGTEDLDRLARLSPSESNVFFSAVVGHEILPASPVAVLVRLLTADLTETATRVFPFNEVKVDHPVVLAPHSRNYKLRYEADPGFTFTEASLEIESQAHASQVQVEVVDGGSAIELAFTLESGPQVDRWRGWLVGRVVATRARTIPGGPVDLGTIQVSGQSSEYLLSGPPSDVAVEGVVLTDDAGRLLARGAPGEALRTPDNRLTFRVYEDDGVWLLAVAGPEGFPPPSFVSEFVYDLPDVQDPIFPVELLERRVEAGALPPEVADGLLRLTSVELGILEEEWPALRVRFTVNNVGRPPLALDLDERFFTLTSDSGDRAELRYFCCATIEGTVLRAGDQYPLEMIFVGDFGWLGKNNPIQALSLEVEGLLPVVREVWRIPLPAVAE